MSAYDEYVKRAEAYANNNEATIKEVLNAKETPQAVLWAKTAYERLSTETAKHRQVPGIGYVFDEELVNRLMHFAYLMGAKHFDNTSFNAGYNSARKELEKALSDIGFFEGGNE